MKKVKNFLLAVAVLLLSPSPVYAVTITNPISLGSIGELINRVSGVVTPLAVLGFIGSVIYAGFVRMTAAGDPEKEKKSMKIAIGAMIGFAIIALAPLIVRVMGSLLNVDRDLLS